MENTVTFYFKTQNFLEGKIYENEGNQYNEIISEYSTIKKLDKSFVININIEKENEIEDFENGFQFLVKDLTFANFNGKTACRKYNQGNRNNIQLQKKYFETVLKYLDQEDIKNTVNFNKNEINLLNNIRKILLDKPSTEAEEEIKDNWENSYKKIISKLKDQKIKEKTLEKLKNNEKVDIEDDENSKIDYLVEEILFYSFFNFENINQNLVSVTLSYEANKLYGLEEIKSNIQENIKDLNYVGIYYIVNSDNDNLQTKLYQVLENKSKDGDFEIYFNKEKNICIEKRKSQEEGYEKKIEEYALSLAYKIYYQAQEHKLAKLSLMSTDNDLEAIIAFASEFAQFQSNFIFGNPTLIQSYKYFYENLDIQEYENRLNKKLDAVIKFIGLEHDKKENIRKQKELLQQELEEKILDKRKDGWGYVLGFIAILFTVLGGIGGYSSVFDNYTTDLNYQWYSLSIFFLLILGTIFIVEIPYKKNNKRMKKLTLLEELKEFKRKLK